MSGPERIWARSENTTDRDSRPVTETGWEDTDHDAKWYADWGKPPTEYVRADLHQSALRAAREAALREAAQICREELLDGKSPVPRILALIGEKP